MVKNILRLSLAAWFALAMVVTQQPLSAAGIVTFTVNVKSVYLRAQPGFAASPAFSVFKDQRYTVVGRTADNSWLQLDFAGASSGAPWVFSSYGAVAGSLADVPVMGDTLVVAVGATQAPVGDSQPAAAFAPVRYTVAVKSLYGLDEPDRHAAKIYSLFKGQSYAVAARSGDSAWLLLDLWGSTQAWVPTVAGTVLGPIAGLPTQAGGPATVAATPAPGPATTAVPLTVSARARAIYQLGLSLGNNPNAFSKIGDCLSVGPFFLASFDTGDYRLGGSYAGLQETIDHFAGSFNRNGAAAHIGLNVASEFDPIWADPHICQDGETPLSCEVRIQRPSIAFISLGTNGSFETNAQYETGMRRIIDQLIGLGVLPILSTKVDNLEGGDRFNQIVIRLAGEYQLPLWDFAAAGRALPGQGLADTYHPTWGRSFFDRGPLFAGWQVRNLTALQTLDSVWKSVK